MAHPVHRMALDLSHHNTVRSFQKVVDAGIVGIIHKATEGTSFVDRKYAGRRKGCLEHGIEWGAYHFATASDVEAQAEHFLETAELHAGDLFCLDWESYGDNTMSIDQARRWIELVEDALGRPGQCVLYSGNVAKEELGNAIDPFFGARRLWLAQYGSNPTVQKSWDDFWLWQYSDGQSGPQPHGCPGVSGYVDTNSYDGTPEQLRAEWASGKQGPSPAPPGLVA